MTNAERYAVLHAAVWPLIDALEARYLVDRADGGVDLDAALGVEVVSEVRLEPRGRGAPIAIALTTFPGLAVRLGRWVLEFFPSCGCDACDEQPEHLLDDFRRHVDAVVAGRFREEVHVHGLGGTLRHELWGEDWRRAETQYVDAQNARALRAAPPVDWAPWTPR